jgi:hypothetical protein
MIYFSDEGPTPQRGVPHVHTLDAVSRTVCTSVSFTVAPKHDVSHGLKLPRALSVYSVGLCPIPAYRLVPPQLTTK